MEEQGSRQKNVTEDNAESLAGDRRRQRIREMQLRKQRQMEFRRRIKIGAPIAAGALILCVIGAAFSHSFGSKRSEEPEREKASEFLPESSAAHMTAFSGAGAGVLETAGKLPGKDLAAAVMRAQSAGIPGENGVRSIDEVLKDAIPPRVYSANTTEDTLQLGEEFASSYAILIDLDSEKVLAQKSAGVRINPASMTKILTLLVASEYLGQAGSLTDDFTVTLKITDYAYSNDCSSVGFAEDETVTVEDLLYGTILPSGADAALGLAEYVAGSQEAFVDLMNEKLEELQLSDTAHMTNCVGLYDENHYCTVYDMAMIMEAAMENELCRKVMSAHTYTTSSTRQHPDGIQLSNWFLRRIEDKDTGGEVLCAKTGYVVQSGNCAASYAVDNGGREYVCVTADAHSGWRCIYDHVELYRQFATG